MTRIITEYLRPPISHRQCDWSAIRDGWEPGDPCGEGDTEAAAIADLLEQEAER